MGPEEHGYEFGGPWGAFAISFGLPILCYTFAFFVNDTSGSPPPSLLTWSRFSLDNLKRDVNWEGFGSLLNAETVFWTLVYYIVNIALYKYLPGQDVEGTILRSGGRLKYRFNGFYTAVSILSFSAIGTAIQGVNFPIWPFINRNYIPLLTANILISYILATYVYIRSFTIKHPKDPQNRELAAGGTTGNMLYDWYIGRELNPRVQIPFVGDFDIKTFCEVRPGLLGWIILDLAFVVRQYAAFGRITDSIVIVAASQTIYMLDAIYLESAIMTQMDITTDGFGFMLAFGDLAWLPFIYSIQARYLSIHPVDLGWVKSTIIIAIFVAGYVIFRQSNKQKNIFRTNPDDPAVSHLKYIQTKTGSRLITSGWWGSARHINYFGDWLMSWAYCLPTAFAGYVIHNSIIPGHKIVTRGFSNRYAGWAVPITYFYMLYFAVLLIHRERRDEAKCRKKYGADWEKYCQQVKWRIIPGIY